MEFHQKNTCSCSSSKTTTRTNVKFNTNSNGYYKDASLDEREKYLTAKYPGHQMALIKKRLKVEFWIDEQLKYLYEINDDVSNDDYDICADDLVDNLLDIETDNERKIFVLDQLKNAKKSRIAIMSFVDELLLKIRML